MKETHTENLIKASHAYIDFINRIARGESFDRMGQAAQIFAPHCKKVFNASLAAESRDSFVADLVSVYQNYGGWKLVPLDILPSTHAVILHLLIETENLGINTAMVILSFDANGLISKINEVFSPVKDGYEFSNPLPQ